MPNTTNYSFPTPADTDLVKNGADAIRDLGDAVDTAMNTALGTKKSGLVLLNTTSFSAVSSVSLAQDTFTSTYDNYRILFRVTSGSASNWLTLRFRTAGTDNTSSTYESGSLARRTNGAATDTGDGTSANVAYVVGYTTADRIALCLDILSPKLAQTTYYSGTAFGASPAGSTTLGSYVTNGAFLNTTVFDSVSFISTAGNITGSYSVFAYAK
jgi:hypothetical protein